jgi:hypothetical protein
MRFIRQYRALLVFGVFLVVCSVLVVRQISANQSRHVELREAFILLHTRGYKPEAGRLFQKLVKEVDALPTKALLDDFQRTLTLVDTSVRQTDNLVWQYHWTVSNELEKRSEESIKRALKLAGQP